MQTRIAMLAVCASAMFMTLTDVASAHYGATAGSNSSVRITDVGAEPVTKLAQNAPIVTTRSNIKRPSLKAQPRGVKSTTTLPRQPAKAPVNTSRSNKKAR